MSQSHTQTARTAMRRNITAWSQDPNLTVAEKLAFAASFVKVLAANPKRKRRKAARAKDKGISLPTSF